MPRRPRVFVAGASDHVYCRVARGERVFADAREAAALVGVIREVVREHGLSVQAWCVMPTHDHLAVRTASVPLWRSIRTAYPAPVMTYSLYVNTAIIA